MAPFVITRTVASKEVRDASHFLIMNNLECKICVNTYKMFFVENTEDVFVFTGPVQLSKNEERQQNEAHSERFRTWLNNRWTHGLDEAEVEEALKKWDEL
jgi:paired amphipathic helix protein Sin3a